jgi:hypothetical protein
MPYSNLRINRTKLFPAEIVRQIATKARSLLAETSFVTANELAELRNEMQMLKTDSRN